MTESELIQARRNNVRRRIIAMRNDMKLPAWDLKETNRLTRRPMKATSLGEGINDFDLRVIVRWFNRELIGAKIQEH